MILVMHLSRGKIVQNTANRVWLTDENDGDDVKGRPPPCTRQMNFQGQGPFIQCTENIRFGRRWLPFHLDVEPTVRTWM